MYTRLMTRLSQIFKSSYNLGRAERPNPLPQRSVRLQQTRQIVEQRQGQTISREALREAFSRNNTTRGNHGPLTQE